MRRMELRIQSSNLTSDDENLVVEGLVNKTENWSHILGNRRKFRERIAKGVFADALRNANRIDFLGEHKQDLLLATTENNSLELWEDDQGLRMRAKIAPTSYGKDFYTLMSEKLISHMSFGFRVIKDVWERGKDGILERTVTKIELEEVSAVRNPAYPASVISARGIELVEDIIPDEVDEMEKEKDEVKEEKTVEVDGKESKIVNLLDKLCICLDELCQKLEKLESKNETEDQEDREEQPAEDKEEAQEKENSEQNEDTAVVTEETKDEVETESKENEDEGSKDVKEDDQEKENEKRALLDLISNKRKELQSLK